MFNRTFSPRLDQNINNYFDTDNNNTNKQEDHKKKEYHLNFEKFDKIPIASGSIAQVYRAVLNGKDVAVKVRHPNVGEQIEIDFIIMKALAAFIDSLPGLNWLNLNASMAQFSDTISSQIRLDIEGRHLYQFNNNFDHWKDTKFPEPIVMTESVLIESFAEGQSVKTYADISASKLAATITTLRLANILFVVLIMEFDIDYVILRYKIINVSKESP